LNTPHPKRATAVLLACAVPLLTAAMTIAPAQAASNDTGTATATANDTVGLSYVALGDSYSAGYGLQPLTALPVPGCAQSAQDYPHQLAAALGLDLTDVTCSGAMTANIAATAQYTGDGTAPPQVTALSDTTRIVTLTIGGDDLGFTDIAAYCAADSPNGPLLLHPSQHDCSTHYTTPGPDNLQAKLATTVSPAIAAVLAAVHTKAPNAKVFVLGYPAIAPDAADTPAAGCFRPTLGFPLPTNGYPFTDADIPFLLQTEQSLDDAIRTDALAAGDIFVPTLQASLAHTPCAASTQPAGTSWINGLSIASLLPPALKPGALHPDAAGVSYLTTQLTVSIKNAFAPRPTSPTHASGPTVHRAFPTVFALTVVLALLAIAAALLLLRRRIRARAGQR
jgi:lysophospholipase L1-like esterase